VEKKVGQGVGKICKVFHVAESTTAKDTEF